LAAPRPNAASKWNAQGSTIFRNSPVSGGNGGHHGQVGTIESSREAAVHGHVDRREPSPARVALVLIHENRLLRETLASVIRKHPEFNLMAALTDVGEIRSHVHDMGSGVVLLNCEGGQDALGAQLAAARTELPDARVIVTGVQPNRVRLAELIQVGAGGFTTRDASAEELFTTISEVMAGEGVLPPALTASLFTELRRPRSSDECVADGAQVLPKALKTTLFTQIVKNTAFGANAQASEGARLTTREQQIIAGLTKGLSNKEIASRLNIAVHTVKSHVHNVLEKLALHSRLEVAAYTHSARQPNSPGRPASPSHPGL
jgi:two-component system nitrate/nitrite response regulator NarL